MSTGRGCSYEKCFCCRNLVPVSGSKFEFESRTLAVEDFVSLVVALNYKFDLKKGWMTSAKDNCSSSSITLTYVYLHENRHLRV